MKIFLIGMPGCGKTTLGKGLAAKLMLDFTDLDSEIEKAEQKSIPEIFAQNGEDHFRLIEANTLRLFAGAQHSFVMATGGGTPCFYSGIETINENGISIFLDVPVSKLVARVIKNQDRPLLRALQKSGLKEKLESLREQRLSCYRQATVIVENPSLEKILKELKPIS
jgi:shikimate kinase